MQTTSLKDKKLDKGLLEPLMFLGFGLFLAWCLYCLFGFPRVLIALASSGTNYQFFVGIFFASFGLGLSLCGLMADRSHLFPNRKLLLMCVGTLLLSLFSTLLPSSFQIPAFLALGCLLSSMSAYFFLCWLMLMSITVTPMTALYYALSAAVAALLSFLVLSLEYMYGSLLALLLVLFQTGVLYILSKVGPKRKEIIPRKESSERRPLYWKTHLAFDSIGLVFGLCFFSISIAAPSHAIITLALICGAVIAAIDIWRSEGVSTVRLRSVVLIVIMLGLLAFPFINEGVRQLVWCVFTGLFSFFFIVQPSWNIVASRKYRLNIIALVPLGQAHIWIAIGLGYVLGWVFNSFDFNLLLLTQILVALLCVFAVFYTPTDMRDMERLAYNDDEPQNKSADKSVSDEPRLHRFFGYCNSVALQYRLTPRESEVLILLAKGRNAGYIANALVLSTHTVKTHIYHIYQKLGINSQQELIDRVDKAVLREE